MAGAASSSPRSRFTRAGSPPWPSFFCLASLPLSFETCILGELHLLLNPFRLLVVRFQRIDFLQGGEGFAVLLLLNKLQSDVEALLNPLFPLFFLPELLFLDTALALFFLELGTAFLDLNDQHLCFVM